MPEEGERLGRIETTLDHMGESLKGIATDMKEDRQRTGQFQIEASNALTALNTRLEAHDDEDGRRFNTIDDRLDGVSDKFGKIMSSRAALGVGGATGGIGVLALIEKIFGILPG